MHHVQITFRCGIIPFFKKDNMRSATIINGWDIGGVNIKAVRAEWHGNRARVIKAVSVPFEIWHNPSELADQLKIAGHNLTIKTEEPHGVTITAELSDAFGTKREGIHFILSALQKAFGYSPVYIFNLKGGFYNFLEAEDKPLMCAATNWFASANYIANLHNNCILIDVGSTTTDIIPIREGKVICHDRTDTGRLINSELVYSGVLRTNPNAIVHAVPVRDKECPVAAEYFTIMADVYLILGDISSDTYSCPTPDKRHKTVKDARSRIARLICADTEMLTTDEIDNMAQYLSQKQTEQISEAILNVLARTAFSTIIPAVVTGTGAFLAERAARSIGIQDVIQWESKDDHNCLPAFSVTSLLNEHMVKL
jgi:(4-(4-[2-(gamma-L-glutamylamino)ethyl]phenoxymethyl)furan-2-yl)methanamine synthase